MSWAYLERRAKESVENPTVYALLPVLFGFLAGLRLGHLTSSWDLLLAFAMLAVGVWYSFVVARAIRGAAQGQ